ncbi:MAG: BlaI/MecI/CopY family transcriptional regulator [Myxococcales bacterium]|nr:BlaI/MecI/CopY family transcriptional regulator [Myxococcales bacterium]MBL0194314.1 BlaI/MecI/CopY family transcriptional regulator [Myxococcales bacterium]HQY61630.1 BlaI/MecI/CopY family transcriptional regulator [Polyangiaceae bacterium]
MTSTLGEQEHEILSAVWQLGTCTVREVHERVGVPRGLAYTTISTVLDRLHKKGFVTRERDGRALVFRPARPERAVERSRVRDLVSRIFGGDPEPAVARLVDAVETYDPALLDRLAEEIAARRRSRRGS